ncbi:MAG: transposase [Burkholderia sp.]
MVSIVFEVMDTTLLDTEKPGSHKGRPNHSPEFRRRIVIVACEPGVSVTKLAREHGLNANLAFTWRHRYRAEQMGARGNAAASDGRERYEAGGHRSATNQTGDRKTGRTRWHD